MCCQVFILDIGDIPVDTSNHGQREALCRLPKWIFDQHKDIDAIALLVSRIKQLAITAHLLEQTLKNIKCECYQSMVTVCLRVITL